MIKGASKQVFVLAAGAAALAGAGGYAWYESRRPAVFEAYIFNTPGSLSAFIRTPDDSRILIGGGSNADIVRRLTGVLPFYSRRIDALIVPNTDTRSVTGLAEVVGRYDVRKVLIPSLTLFSLGLVSTRDPAYAAFLETVAARHIPVEEYSAGTHLSFGTVNASVLFPISEDSFRYSKASSPELCLRVSYGEASLLFIGAATPKVQKFVAASSTESNALIVSQSTGQGNISRELLEAVRPGYLVYSQALSKSSSKPKLKSAAKTNKKAANKKADSLAGILLDHHFNIRERGEVKITSDGTSVEII
ncbi:MAG: internalization-like protein competence protein ComEC/Rec2, competence protein ComEC protein [Candidatus Parcubacteria bacterium]|nr:internalization-like protein competence protein ComEC/Rec2, competence protein ComEC protein [Candidatus Parcubacteria bacterium]